MWYLKFRMYLLLGVLFGIIYMAMTIIGVRMGIANFYFYLILSVGLMFLQYMAGPKIVEWSMKVKYIGQGEHPKLRHMVEELAHKANIPTPRIGIAQIKLPNAFAFGRGPSDGRICVTEGIMQLLDERELRAVMGHEISHLKNRDVVTIMVLSVIPMILYRVAWHFMFFGGGRRRGSGSSNGMLIGMAAFLFYFVTNLLVLYASRIREYFADRGSILLGNEPAALASGLYKLAYGSAKIDKAQLKETEGLKAFFVNDPSTAMGEVRALSQLDLDKSGTISSSELAALEAKRVSLNFGDVMLELLSTHPNMLKRIQQISQYKRGG